MPFLNKNYSAELMLIFFKKVREKIIIDVNVREWLRPSNSLNIKNKFLFWPICFWFYSVYNGGPPRCNCHGYLSILYTLYVYVYILSLCLCCHRRSLINKLSSPCKSKCVKCFASPKTVFTFAFKKKIIIIKANYSSSSCYNKILRFYQVIFMYVYSSVFQLTTAGNNLYREISLYTIKKLYIHILNKTLTQ